MSHFPPHNLPKYVTWESAFHSLFVAHQSHNQNSGVDKVSDSERMKREALATKVLAEIEEELTTSSLTRRDFGIAQNLRGQLKELLGLNKIK